MKMKIKIKKPQPNICKLRKFLNENLDKIEDDLFYEGYRGRYSGENYVNNSRSKSISLSYYYDTLERISFFIKGQKPLVIIRESDYDYEYEEYINSYNYKLVSDYVNLEDYITDEMKAVMHEANCRMLAKHRFFKESRTKFITSTIKEVLEKSKYI